MRLLKQNDIVSDGDTYYRIVAALGSTVYLQKIGAPMSGNHVHTMQEIEKKYKIEFLKEK